MLVFQCTIIYIVDSNDCLNSLLSSFNSLHKEISFSFHLVNNFSNRFSFYIVNCRDKNIVKTHLLNLDKIIEDSYTDLETIIIISNASIKKMSLLLFYMSVLVKIFWLKQFIMQSMLLLLKLNCLLSDTGLIKLFMFKMSIISLLSQMLSTQQGRSLIHSLTLINYNLL